jgi:hypothetical protein
MTTPSKILLAAASIGLLSVVAASSQTAPSLNGGYKGSLVCAQMPGMVAVLSVPLDINVTDNAVTFARPILNGNQVIGNEMAKGTVNEGSFNLTSTGNERGTRYEGKYSGAIVADGGTFTGTQSWTAGTVTRTRSCFGAFAKSGS